MIEVTIKLQEGEPDYQECTVRGEGMLLQDILELVNQAIKGVGFSPEGSLGYDAEESEK